MSKEEVKIRRATPADAEAIGHLLHDFNLEFSEPSPGAEAIAARSRELLGQGEITVLLAGDGPDGLALVRFRAALWTPGQEAYLQELYVVPGRRGNGIGEALLEATIAAAREAGATGLDLNTGETDAAARRLYEKLGFTNREGAPDGPAMLFYEREI